MRANDVEATYRIASETGRLIGDIVGSPAVGARIVSSLFLPCEKPSEKNIQSRLREALMAGNLSVLGLGPRGLKRLQSALALGKALYLDVPKTGTVVDDPAIAASAFHEIAWSPVENFAVMALDIKHRVLSMRVIAVGTATETYAHPRDIFSWVLQTGGNRCILAHNHPSGSVEPSEDDLALTKQLLEAGTLLGIPVMDHLVVSGNGYLSIREHTDLWANTV
jgi:DNA repair protein RadC